MYRQSDLTGKPVVQGMFSAPLRYGCLFVSILPICIASLHAQELGFSGGEVTGRFDNTVSYGVAVRTQGADRNLAAETSGTSDFYSELSGRNVRTQANKNDGDNNFSDAGDIVAQVVKWNSLLELSWKDYGVQVSGFAFYDAALADLEGAYGTDQDFINSVDSQDRLTNLRLSDAAADYAVSDVRLSSAYVWGDFAIGSHTLNVRLGEQVLSWGEALFMQDGINQVNPADLSALRLPGAEIKDALLPLPMLVLSAGLTESLSAEAFYEFGWQRSEPDPVGTFYSSTDALVGYGSAAAVIDLRGGSAESLAELYNFYVRGGGMVGNSYVGDPVNGFNERATKITNNKLNDVKPPDDGQYGFNLRYLAESLNNTEFGFYFLNTHARKPTAGAVAGEAFGSAVDVQTCQAAYTALAAIGVTPAGCADNLNILGGSQGATAAQIVGGLNTIHYIDSTSYFLQYEDNMQVWGLTFSSNIGQVSLSGELAWRPDAEFIPEVGDNLLIRNAALIAPIVANGGTISVGGNELGDHITSADGSTLVSAGDMMNISDNKDMLNVSLVAIYNFGPALGTDGLTGIAEWGGAWVNGLDPNKNYAAENAMGYVPRAGFAEGNPGQYLDEFSWGYRLVVLAEFNDAFAGLNVKPQVRFAHDVDGNSVFGGNFMEDRMSATVAVDADRGGDWSFGVGANAFWGRDGQNEGNQLADRDSVYANVKYSF